MISSEKTTPLRWVVDTNVVIDWLMFNDPYMSPMRERVADGRLVVLTHLPALEELKRVLAYRQLKLSPDRQQEIYEKYCQHTSVVTLPAGASLKNLLMPGGFPRCRDRDDEHFIALAYHHQVDALVSRDNAVFGLKSRAKLFGLNILNVQQAIGSLIMSELAELPEQPEMPKLPERHNHHATS